MKVCYNFVAADADERRGGAKERTVRGYNGRHSSDNEACCPYLCKSTTEILRHQASRPRWKRRANPIGPYVPTDVACSRNHVVVRQESNGSRERPHCA